MRHKAYTTWVFSAAPGADMRRRCWVLPRDGEGAWPAYEQHSGRPAELGRDKNEFNDDLPLSLLSSSTATATNPRDELAPG
jgi:hypothetical protein